MDEIKDTDTRLSNHQKYTALELWNLDHVTWNKDEEDFEVYKIDPYWRVQTEDLRATSPDKMTIQLLEENTRINRLILRVQSQLYWKSRDVPAKIFHHGGYTIWERKQHTEIQPTY